MIYHTMALVNKGDIGTYTKQHNNTRIMRLIQYIRTPFAPANYLRYSSSITKGEISISSLTILQREFIMKKNVIKSYFALSLLVSAVGPYTMTVSMDTEIQLNNLQVSEKTHEMVAQMIQYTHQAVECARERNDEFFSTKNKETLPQHIEHIKKNLNFITEYILTPLEQITLEQPPNTLDYQLLQELTIIVNRVIKGINKLENTLTTHQKSWWGRTVETAKLAASLQELKKELTADFIVLEKELENLQAKMNTVYNNALLAGKVESLRKYVTDLNNAKSPSSLALLAALNHRLRCK